MSESHCCLCQKRLWPWQKTMWANSTSGAKEVHEKCWSHAFYAQWELGGRFYKQMEIFDPEDEEKKGNGQ